jgi:hypothetical protein
MKHFDLAVTDMCNASRQGATGFQMQFILRLLPIMIARRMSATSGCLRYPSTIMHAPIMRPPAVGTELLRGGPAKSKFTLVLSRFALTPLSQ